MASQVLKVSQRSGFVGRQTMQLRILESPNVEFCAVRHMNPEQGPDDEQSVLGCQTARLVCGPLHGCREMQRAGPRTRSRLT